jgi:hypothetical protein
MQSSELWAAWIVAALMVGMVAWVGHIAASDTGLRDTWLTPASEVARRAPVSLTLPPSDVEELPVSLTLPPSDAEELPAAERIGPSLPALHPGGPSSGQPPRVFLCLIDGRQRGVC